MRKDWRISPREQSLDPPDDDEETAEKDLSRREDEEVERFMEGR